jgi:hypothetical protein
LSPAEKLLLNALRGAEWQDKHIYPVGGATYQNWKLTVYLPVKLSAKDKSPEAALKRALLDAAK